MSTLMDALQRRTRTEGCACGNDLVVAWWQNAYHLRCSACGYDPETKLRDTRGLRQLFMDGMALSTLEAQTLRQQLYKEINRAQSEGRSPNKQTAALFERLERTMGTAIETKGAGL